MVRTIAAGRSFTWRPVDSAVLRIAGHHDQRENPASNLHALRAKASVILANHEGTVAPQRIYA
jgi:hypothetical protein